MLLLPLSLTLFLPPVALAVPSERYEVDPELAKALEIIFILHLDHEQNASTSTVRTAGSSQANPFACVASGIAALWGPAHGGANEAVLKVGSLFRGSLNRVGPLLSGLLTGRSMYVCILSAAPPPLTPHHWSYHTDAGRDR